MGRSGAYNEVMMTSLFRAALVFGCLGLSPSPSFAGAAEAERYRLQTELENLARKNAWTGVNRVYQDLTALGLPLQLSDYMLGSQASIQLGDLLEGLKRLQLGLAAATPDDDPQSDYARAKDAANAILGRFGVVQILVGDCVPVLILQPLPFAQDERDALNKAREQVRTSKSYTGLLPAGSYSVDTIRFDVVAGQSMAEIKVCM